MNLDALMGDTRCVLSTAQALKRQGHVVQIYTPAFDPKAFPELSRGIEVRVVPQNTHVDHIIKVSGILMKAWRRIKTSIWAFRAAKSLARAMDKDLEIIDCHDGYTYRVGYFYHRINPKTKIMWNVHNFPFVYLKKENTLQNFLGSISTVVESFIERFFFGSIYGTMLPDNKELERARKLGLRSKVVREGLDFDAFYRPVEFRYKTGKPLYLLGVGGLSPYRRFEDIVAAVAILRRRGYDARGIIIGRDFWQDRSYRKSFDDMVEQSGAKKYIEWDPNGVSEDGLKKAYAKSDVFIYPMAYLWGLAPCEAAAAGLPNIITRTSSNAELFRDGESALFVDGHRPDQIADQVEKLVRDPKFYKRVAAAGQKLMKDEISWHRRAKEFVDFAVS